MSAEIETAGKTAIPRSQPPLPIRDLVSGRTCIPPSLIKGVVVYHGSGKDYESQNYILNNFRDVNGVIAYDPNHRPMMGNADLPKADIVLSMYVMNVLPPKERKKMMQEVKALLVPGGRAFFAARSDKMTHVNAVLDQDGVRTCKGTFQKRYTERVLVDDLNTVFRDALGLTMNMNSGYVIAEVRA